VLQRAQYESDYQTAIVNARTAKITLLTLLNERTPVDQFDVTGRSNSRRRLWRSKSSAPWRSEPDLI